MTDMQLGAHPPLNFNWRAVFLGAGRFLLFLNFAAVILFFRNYVRIKVGPIYVLEAVALLWIGLTLSFLLRRDWKETIRTQLPFLCFGALGFFWFATDALTHGQAWTPREWSWNAQKTLLFIYPLIWSTIGYFAFEKASQRRLFVTALVCVTFIQAILLYEPTSFSIWGLTVDLSYIHKGVGPLFVGFSLFALTRSSFLELGRLKATLCVLGLLLAMVPFWNMWTDHMQRSVLAIFVAAIALVPILSRKRGDSFLKPVLVSLSTYGLFFLGFVLVALLQTQVVSAPKQESAVSSKPSVREQISKNFEASMVHADDRVKPFKHEKKAKLPFSRSRLNFWGYAFEQFRDSPVLGVGIQEEVPYKLSMFYPNVFGSVFPTRKDTPPMNGPHNSYLTILARTGLVGFTFFLWIVFSWSMLVVRAYKRFDFSLFEVLGVVIPILGFVAALANPVLETPHQAALIWFFMGCMYFHFRSKLTLADQLGVEHSLQVQPLTIGASGLEDQRMKNRNKSATASANNPRANAGIPQSS